MADRERAVCRSVSRAEARPAERSLDDCASVNKRGERAVLHKLHVDWHGSRVNVQKEFSVSSILSLQDVGSRADVLKSAARAACDNALVNVKLSANHLVFKAEFHLVAE